jgi:hypothetical protein
MGVDVPEDRHQPKGHKRDDQFDRNQSLEALLFQKQKATNCLVVVIGN